MFVLLFGAAALGVLAVGAVALLRTPRERRSTDDQALRDLLIEAAARLPPESRANETSIAWAQLWMERLDHAVRSYDASWLEQIGPSHPPHGLPAGDERRAWAIVSRKVETLRSLLGVDAPQGQAADQSVFREEAAVTKRDALRFDATPENGNRTNNGFWARLNIRLEDEPGDVCVKVVSVDRLAEGADVQSWSGAWINEHCGETYPFTDGEREHKVWLAAIRPERSHVKVQPVMPALIPGGEYRLGTVLSSAGRPRVVFTVQVINRTTQKSATRRFEFGWQYPSDERPLRDGEPSYRAIVE